MIDETVCNGGCPDIFDVMEVSNISQVHVLGCYFGPFSNSFIRNGAEHRRRISGIQGLSSNACALNSLFVVGLIDDDDLVPSMVGAPQHSLRRTVIHLCLTQSLRIYLNCDFEFDEVD